MKYTKTLRLFILMLMMAGGNLYAQNTSEIGIRSKVYDQYGQPVRRASISVLNGDIIGYTDTLGNFTVNVPANSNILIAAKGFKEKVIKADAIQASIALEADNSSEDYMVNLLNKKVNRKDLFGAITVIKPADFIDQDYSLSIQDGMSGRIAGLLGSNNIWGLENALILIDGVARDINDITLNEVEQITVLKGVNAVALYGSQAAKGAILITSKRGINGPRQITVRANKGISTPTRLPEYLGSADYMALYNEARRNDGIPVLYTDNQIASFRNGNRYRYPDVDYYSSEYIKKFLQTTDVNASFSGGNSNARFFSNLGWSSNTSLLNFGEGSNEKNNRFNLRGNVDIKLNSFITTSLDVSAVLNDNRTGLGNYWNSAAVTLPNKYAPLIPIDMINNSAALFTAKQSRNIIDGAYILGGAQDNLITPFADLLVGGYNKFIRRAFQITNNINVDLSGVLPGLSFQTRLSVDFVNSYNQSINNTYSVYAPTWSATADSITGLAKFGNDTRTGNENINNTAQVYTRGLLAQLSYDKVINSAHGISAALVGYGSSIETSGVYQPSSFTNLGVQLGYNYKHKYWADFTGAFVNSRKLPEGNRTAFSPTASLGWLISAENFLADSKVVDELKLTASAGILNTDLDINNYYLYDNIYTTQAGYSWSDGLFNNNATGSLYGGNPDFSFSKRKEFNAGVEGSFFQKLLNVQATYFITRISDLPTQRFSQYPNYYNPFIPYSNYNNNQFAGIDFAIGFNKKAGEVNLNLGVTGTYITTKVIKRDELWADTYQNRVGKSVSGIFGLENKGFFVDQADIAASPVQAFGEVKPGDIKYADQNGDNIINERDEVMIGRFLSPFNFGLNIAASYKNFTVFVRGTGSFGGNGITNNNYFWVDGDDKYSELVLNRWTPDTKSTATFPRLTSLQNTNNFRSSDFWMYKTNRATLNKVQITYNLPKAFIDKSFVKELCVYAIGSNLYTFSKNKDIMELTIGAPPQLRNFLLGLRVNF
jgi:TonB-linked SusC/RagA family outer membrane protein